jgi:hypothetical protein
VALGAIHSQAAAALVATELLDRVVLPPGTGLTPAPAGVESCPADPGIGYVVAFSTTDAAAPDIVSTAGGCDDVTVSAGGHQLGVLADSAAFRAAYLSALGLPSAG